MANTKHESDGTWSMTSGNKVHAQNLAKAANVLGCLTPSTKTKVTNLADSVYGKLQQPYDAETVLGVAIASMPYPVSIPQVLTVAALGHLANPGMTTEP